MGPTGWAVIAAVMMFVGVAVVIYGLYLLDHS